MYINSQEAASCVLISVDIGEYDINYSLNELDQLAVSCGLEVFCYVFQKRSSYDKSTFIGKGKLEELIEIIETNNIKIAIFDNELTSTQIKNIEKIIGIKVIDRTMLILDIFALNAKSKEGILQVKLAQNKYRLSRLSGIGVDLDRQGGVGSRGPGEKKLELDRRKIKDEITVLKKEISELSERRERLREGRKKKNVTNVSIIGYTNAGKSTLLNCLTDSSVLAKNKLFATLDPTSRMFNLPDGREIMITDTVGFISRLPHNLVESFKSTLEEVKYSDVILHLVDISNSNYLDHILVTENILSQLKCSDIPIIKVFNKFDLLIDKNRYKSNENEIYISAEKNINIDVLLNQIQIVLNKKEMYYKIYIPYDQLSIINIIRENGVIKSEQFKENFVEIECILPSRLSYLGRKFNDKII